MARLEGGESLVAALVAAPVLAAAVASDGGAALSVIANMDPLYLSENPGTWFSGWAEWDGGEGVIAYRRSVC